jgi:GNAT superfamily N-acetyltransferase
MNLPIEIYSERDLSSIQRVKLEEWFEQEFGHIPYQWATPAWYVLARVDSVLVSRLGIVERVVAVDRQSIRVAGISGVITHPEWRGRKIASAVLNKAVEFIKSEMNAEFALLLCRQEVTPVYARLGWKIVNGPTTFWQPGRKLTYPKLTMVLECGQKSWPIGPIDLGGLPW